jgi:ATP-dependent Zn protease
MKDAIDGIGQLKMIMIGGHDSSVDILMNFLSGMNIVKRTEYPHYAFNILFELRKYNNQYYIEIYYNDNLKYNKTMDEFKNVLDKSKYSDMNNYCKTFHSVKINIKPENKTKKFRIKIINYIIIIVLVLIVIGIIIFLVIRRKKKKLDTSKSIANISTNTNISTTDIIKK